MEYKIVRWTYFMPRSANLASLMILTPDEDALIERAIDEKMSVYLGEVSGKHPDVSVTLSGEQFEEIECSPGFAAEAARVFDPGVISGIDLLGAIEEQFEEWDEDDDEDEEFLEDLDTDYDFVPGDRDPEDNDDDLDEFGGIKGDPGCINS